MKKFLLLMTIFTALTLASFAQWTTLCSDAGTDGQNPNYLDGTKLEYMYDSSTDSIYFRVTVSQYKANAFGINIIMNVTGAGSTGTWWGNQNSSFKYNRLITAWMSTPPMGTVGITDAAGAAANNYTKIAGASKITVIGDPTAKTYTLRMLRTDIFNDTSLKADVIAAVGSNAGWNDDLPNTGSGSLDVAPPPSSSIIKISAADAGYNIFPNPSSGIITVSRKNSNQGAVINIYNAIGQKILQEELSDASIRLDLTSQSNGIYYINILSDEKQINSTVVLNK